MDKKELGKVVRKYRQEKGMKIQDLSEQVKIEPNSLGAIERGERYPSIPTLTKIISVLDVSADKLLFNTSPAKKIQLNEISERIIKLDADDYALVQKIIIELLEHFEQ